MAKRRFSSAEGPRKGRVGDGGEFLVPPSKCVLGKGELPEADRRYKYKQYYCLSSSEKERARNAYTHNAPGIPASAYAYPIDATGQLARGRVKRALVWGYKRVKRKARRS